MIGGEPDRWPMALGHALRAVRDAPADQSGQHYVFAGTAGVNPLFIIISLFLIMAWRVAGWYGLDRIVLPKLGTPWQPGSVFKRRTPEPASTPAAPFGDAGDGGEGEGTPGSTTP
jgi:hypothetical protein